MMYGIEHESNARGALSKILKLPIQNSGLVLHRSGALAASPDGIIDSETIVEIKCMSKFRSDRSGDLNHKPYGIVTSKDGKMSLAKSSIYYDQIQLQLHVCEAKLCYLMLYIPMNSIVVKVPKDAQWTPNVDKLVEYYFSVVLPKLIGQI